MFFFGGKKTKPKKQGTIAHKKQGTEMTKNRAKKKHTEIVPYFSTTKNSGGKKQNQKKRNNYNNKKQGTNKNWAKTEQRKKSKKFFPIFRWKKTNKLKNRE